jgi:hypothetical protein
MLVITAALRLGGCEAPGGQPLRRCLHACGALSGGEIPANWLFLWRCIL